MKLYPPISHPSHPQHKLERCLTLSPIKCNGCSEAGIGHVYKCHPCDFDLHEICASRPFSTKPPFYSEKHKFLFHSKPSDIERKCDACFQDVLGFRFHCKCCDNDLHPRCAQLPLLVHDGKIQLHLRRKKLSRPCYRCREKGPGWSYRSDCKNYYLHVACAKEMLIETWDDIDEKVGANKVTELQRQIPKLEVTPKKQQQGEGEGKVRKWGRFIAVAVRVFVSAFFGDPTALFAATAVGVSNSMSD